MPQFQEEIRTEDESFGHDEDTEIQASNSDATESTIKDEARMKNGDKNRSSILKECFVILDRIPGELTGNQTSKSTYMNEDPKLTDGFGNKLETPTETATKGGTDCLSAKKEKLSSQLSAYDDRNSLRDGNEPDVGTVNAAGKLQSFKCNQCFKSFGDKSHFRSHIRWSHKYVKALKCTGCELSFPTKQSLKRHIAEVHEKVKILKCSKCDYSCVRPHALKRHFKSVHKNLSPKKPFKCNLCFQSYSKKPYLLSHLRWRHIEPLKCSRCELSFPTRQSLQTHNAAVHKLKLLKCPHCDYSCKIKRELKKHFKSVHKNLSPQKSFKCKQCLKSCSSKFVLLSHVRWKHINIEAVKCSNDELSFKCDQCLKSFGNKSNLLSHVRWTHENSKALIF